ncbi:MAG: HupE/UreJ family protein [Burkholderiaceae bacterium]|nr:HupE/UreJ family protein [Burkholderiaceae bacterium]
MRHPVPKLVAASALLLPALAFAHAGHVESGVMAGLVHPFTGLDHLLVIVGVGLWGARRGGSFSQAMRMPLLFVGMMLVGALAARAGLQVPALEPLLAASLLVIGLALSTPRGGPALLAYALCAMAGVLHGAAHGQELQGAGALAGMLVATVAGHALGLLAGRRLGTQGAMAWRLLGLTVAGAGAGLLLT